MDEGALEVIIVLDIRGNVATVQLPDTSEEAWSLASLPADVQPGDRIGVQVDGGDFEMTLLPRHAGLQA